MHLLIFPIKSVRVFVVKVVWIKVDVAVEAIDLGAVQVQFVSAEGRRLSRAAASDFVLVTFRDVSVQIFQTRKCHIFAKSAKEHFKALVLFLFLLHLEAAYRCRAQAKTVLLFLVESLAKSSGRACSAWLRLNPEYLASVIANTPFVLQLLMLVHFTDDLLAEFIREHVEICQIENVASEFEFQHFILDLLVRFEKRGNKKLSNFITDYRLYVERRPSLRSNLEWLVRIHWPTKSLGLDYVFPNRLGTLTMEHGLFNLKFKDGFFARHACPTLPDSLTSLLPEESSPTFGRLFKYPSVLPQRKRSYKRFVEFELERDTSLRERFCSRLAGMYHMLNSDLHHEALIYCFELLEERIFENANFHISMFVWGGLAVILSAYNLSDVCIQSCIHKMKVLTFYESDKFDLAWVRQQVYSNQNKIFREKTMFELIFYSSLPKSSAFCSNSLLLHLKTQLNQFNNWICEIVLFKKTLIVNRRRVRDQIGARLEMAYEDIARLKKILHHVNYLGCPNYKKHQKYFAILEFYLGIFRHCTSQFDFYYHIDRMKMLECQNETFCLSAVVEYLNNENTTNLYDYRARMEEMKTDQEKLSHQASSRSWADHCFVQFVFLAHSDSDTNLVEWMLEEAKSFYCRVGHSRAVLLKDFETCERTGKLNFEEQTEELDSEPVKNVTAEMLLRLEPKLKYLLLAGTKTFKIYHDSI